MLLTLPVHTAQDPSVGAIGGGMGGGGLVAAPVGSTVGGRMARASGAPIPQSLCPDRDLASSRRMLLKLSVVVAQIPSNGAAGVALGGSGIGGVQVGGRR